jgi:hypothetical protein
MYGIGICDFCCRNDIWDTQITGRACWWPNTYCLIGKLDVKASLIGCRVYRHGLDAHFAAGTDNSQGNFSAICYQNLFKQNDERV